MRPSFQLTVLQCHTLGLFSIDIQTLGPTLVCSKSEVAQFLHWLMIESRVAGFP